jgi:nicotinamide-nucleotide amidase
MSARAGIVVTGTEVLSGIIADRNGPWLAERLRERGVQLAYVMIVGDRPEDLRAALEFLAREGMDLIITSGGLGPTADDLTAEVVGGFQGREMVLDDALEQKIADILEPLMKRWRNLDFDAVREANRKQAVIPAGSFVIDPAGTAPGLVVPPADGREGPTVVVMPGPPRELHEMWPKAVESDEFGKATASRIEYEQRMLRLFGIPESEIAETLRVAEPTVEGFEQLEITTCLRRGELEVVVRHEPATRSAYDALEGVISERHGQYLYSTDGSTIDDQVSELLGDMQIAVGESCTGGLMAARLTSRPGSSGCVQGGVVAYSDEAKEHLLGVPSSLIEEHGAVSPEVAEALADGAINRFDAQVGVGITGIAGPDGGTRDKPVGYVCWCVKMDSGRKIARDIRLPGDRNEIRDRSTTVAMHMLRRLLSGEELPI